MTEKQYLKALGKKITHFRESQGVSVQDLAQMIDISRMQLYRIEDGENPTSILVLRRISIALNIEIEELVNIKNKGYLNEIAFILICHFFTM